MTGELENIVLKITDLVNILTPPNFYYNWTFWSIVILTITLAVLIWYTIETHKLAVQAKDNNLRPVILRSGFLENWEDLQYTFEDNYLNTGQPIEFKILKNIATSINGYVIKNGKRYDLLFGSSASQVSGNKIRFEKNFWWMETNTHIYAIFNEKGQETKKKNQIIVQYKDIEGNKYYTIENENFDQKSFKGNI